MDSLRQGFGLGFGLFAALITIVLIMVFCVCCVVPVGLMGLGTIAAETTPLARRPTRTPLPPMSQGDQTAPPSAAQPGQPAAANAGLNQDVMVGQVRWKFLEAVDRGNTLTDDNQFTNDVTTSGRFIQVRLEIENRSASTLNFTAINLIDNQGRTFQNSATADVFLATANQAEYCILQQLNPNITKTCTQFFEVPTDAHGLKAQVGDLEFLGDSEALIDLGLP